VTTQWIFLSLLLIGVNFLNLANAEDSSQDWYKKAEIQDHEFQLQLEKSAVELKKMELERLKMDAEYTKQEAEDKEKELNDRMEQSLQEHEAATKEAANEAQNQIEQAEVRHKNQFYMGVFILTFTIFVWRVVKNNKQEGFMKDYEKYGILIILTSTLLILFAIMISAPWVNRYDFVQNLMTVLSISLFAEDEDCKYNCIYMIDFPTKYAVFSLLTLATYGFTTYLGITPAYKMSSLGVSDKNEDIT